MTKRTGWTIPLGEARLNSDGEFWYHGTDRIVGPQEIKRRGIQPPAKQRPEIRDYRDLLGVSVSKARHNYGRAYFASDFEHSQMFAGTGGPIYRVATKDLVRYRPRAIKDYASVKYVYTSRSVRPKHLQVTRDQGRTWKPVREAYFPSDDGYWYHGTAAKNVLSIRRKGLLSAFRAGREPNYPREGGPGWKNPEGLLHLTKYADAAHNWHAATGYGRDDGNPGKGVVLRVPSHVVNRLRPSLDRNAVQAFYKPFPMQAANREVDTITVSRPVHPRHVEMLTAKGWRPLLRRPVRTDEAWVPMRKRVNKLPGGDRGYVVYTPSKADNPAWIDVAGGGPGYRPGRRLEMAWTVNGNYDKTRTLSDLSAQKRMAALHAAKTGAMRVIAIAKPRAIRFTVRRSSGGEKRASVYKKMLSRWGVNVYKAGVTREDPNLVAYRAHVPPHALHKIRRYVRQQQQDVNATLFNPEARKMAGLGESRHTDAMSDGLIHSTVHPFTVYKNPTASDWHELASHPLSAPVGYSTSNPAPHKAEFRVLIHKRTGDLYAWPAYAMFHHGVCRLLGHGPVTNAFARDIAVKAHDGTIKPELRFGAFAAWQKSRTKTAETV